MVLDDEQQTAVDAALSDEAEGAMLNASEVGTGKTVVSLRIARCLGARTILVIGPLQTRGEPLGEDDPYASGWEGEAMQERMGLPFRQIDSTVSGQKALADWGWQVPGIYFVGTQMFVQLGWERKQVFNRDNSPRLKNGKPVYKDVRTKVWAQRPDVVILDEIHSIQNHTSKTFKTAMQLDAGFRMGLSGTPTGNGFDGAYAVTKFLWPHRAEKNIYDFRRKWAITEYDHFAVRNERTVGERNPGEYFNSLPCYVRIESKLDIHVDSKDIYVDLLPEQRRVYTELEQQMVAWIEDHPMVTSLPVTKRIRQRQATLAMPTLVQRWNAKKEEMETHVTFALDAESAKIDRMWSILEEDFNGETAIIFTDSEPFAEALTWQLNRKYGEDSARKWSGKVPRVVRNENKAAFLRGEYKYFVAVIRSVGTGTNLLQKVCWNMLYMSSDDSGIDNEQGDGRTLRRGQVSGTVRIRRLLARNTIDTGQLSNLTKQALERNKSLKKRR